MVPVEPKTLRTDATAADGTDGLLETAPLAADLPALAPPDGGALGRADGRDCATVDARCTGLPYPAVFVGALQYVKDA